MACAVRASGIAIRLAVKTEPSMQWSVEREIRLRVKEALEDPRRLLMDL